MRKMRPLTQTLLGVGLFCLGSLGFMGCDEGGSLSQTPPDEPMRLAIGLAAPIAPSQSDMNDAQIPKPSSGNYAALFKICKITMPGGRYLDLKGSSPALQVDYGADGTIDGNVALSVSANHAFIQTCAPIILPPGDNCFYLAPGTVIEAYLPKPSYINTNYCTKITKLCICFTVYDTNNTEAMSARSSTTPYWTLPSSFDVSLKTKNYKSYIAGSSLHMLWDYNMGCIAPIDENNEETVLMECSFFRDGSKVIDCMDNTPIEDNECDFAATNPQEFDRMEFCVDFRDGHETGINHD